MAELKLVAVNHRTPEQFAKLINEKWQEQVSSIVEVGLLLEAAKAELKHGEWLKMIREELPFGERTAQRLIQVADNVGLSNATTWSLLPVAWRVLYELTLLTDEQFGAAVAAGNIHPKMGIKDAKALRGIVPKPKGKKPALSDAISLVDRCAMDVRASVFAVIKEISVEERAALFLSLRADLDDLETKWRGR